MAKKVTPRFKSSTRQKTFFREWRKHRGLTLEQVAERAGMTPGNLSAMERGKQGYTQDGLEALAGALNCDPAHLLMVDPSKGDAIWSIWDHAQPGEREKIVSIARTIVGRTGTGG